ncbi:MAG: hypothetical protein ACFB21_13285 [Opitutales bacterium]
MAFSSRSNLVHAAISALAAGAAVSAAFGAAELTTVTLTDQVLVPDVERLGIHFGSDDFYSAITLKNRVQENFEGGINRLHLIGPADQPDPMGFYTQRYNANETLPEEHIGATGTIVCGPDIWKEVEITGVEVRSHPLHNRDTLFYQFDQPVTWEVDGWVAGVLLDWSDLTQGQHPWRELRRRNVDGKRKRVYEINNNFITNGKTEIVTGDVPPGGQYAAMKIDGRNGPAHFAQRVQFHEAAPVDGEWTATLWAKAASGTPTLYVGPNISGSGETLQPTDEWQEFTVSITVDAIPQGQNPIFNLQARADGGEVLIDNLILWKNEYVANPDNPTAFRDEIIETFRFLNPGSVRYLRNNRDALYNWLLPQRENFAQDGVGHRGTDPFGTHEFYEFCAHIGADPWANLPGTMKLEEMDLLMEYHAGPPSTRGGALRARLGQERPWSEVFDKIHIQFGNEAITFFGTGFYGSDYWTALIDRIKQSPHYEEGKYIFHINEQGCGANGLREHPQFDRMTISGYHIFGLYDDQLEAAGDLHGFYDFVFASAWHIWNDSRHNKWSDALRVTAELGKEISIYEGLNYHTTFSDDNPPLERINKMLAGRTGGMSAFHTGLILLKTHGARTVQNFNLSQFSFNPGGAFGNLPDAIRGWGGVLRIGNSEQRRYRPRFLAHHIANQVVGGNLIETVHGGADPKFSVTNRFGAGYGPSRDPKEMTISDIPRVHSYAFAEGNRRGLILVSNDTRETHPVQVNFPGNVAGGKAKAWWMQSDGLEDTNEHDWAPEAPQVTVEEVEVPFAPGQVVQLLPGTIMAMEWTVQ